MTASGVSAKARATMTLCKPCRSSARRRFARVSTVAGGGGWMGVEVRNVGLPWHCRVQTFRQRCEHAVEQIPARDFEELVAVERKDKIGAVTRQRLAHGAAHDLGLQIANARVTLDLERQALRHQRVQDLRGPIARAVVDNQKPVEQGEVVPNEAFDDVGLVAQHHRAEELHCGRQRASCGSVHAKCTITTSAATYHDVGGDVPRRWRRVPRRRRRRQSASLRRWRAMRDTAKAAEARRAHLT